MSEATNDFIEVLVGTYPRLRPIFVEHVSDNFGEVLPHVFFGDLTRYVVSRFLDIEWGTQGQSAEVELRNLLSDLEDAYADGGEDVQELISVSFLENLPRPDEEAAGLRAWLGPQLSAQLRVIG
jgi:hypothetical protein